MSDVVVAVFTCQRPTTHSSTGSHYLWIHTNTARRTWVMFTPPSIKSPPQKKCFHPFLLPASAVVTPCYSHLYCPSPASREHAATENTKAIFPQIAEKTSPELAARPATFLRLRKIFFCRQTIIEFAVFTAGLPPHVFRPADVAQLLPMTRWPETHYTNSQQGGVYTFHTADVQPIKDSNEKLRDVSSWQQLGPELVTEKNSHVLTGNS